MIDWVPLTGGEIPNVGSVPLGSIVHDSSAITVPSGDPAPTGTVTYKFFNNSTGTGTPISTQTVTVGSNGTVLESNNTSPLTASTYSFVAHYSGDAFYSAADGAVEPLIVNTGGGGTGVTVTRPER